MKTILISLATMMISLAVQAADGSLVFVNFSSAMGFDARVTYDDSVGAPLAGKYVETASGLVAQLFVKGFEGSFSALTPVSSFRTGAAAGRWDLNTIRIPNAYPDMTFRVAVFEAGKSYETSALSGRSLEFTATPGIVPDVPAFISNLRAFKVGLGGATTGTATGETTGITTGSTTGTTTGETTGITTGNTAGETTGVTTGLTGATTGFTTGTTGATTGETTGATTGLTGATTGFTTGTTGTTGATTAASTGFTTGAASGGSVPEPSIIALAVAGGAALLLRRRKQ